LGKAPAIVQFILTSLEVWLGAKAQFAVGPPVAAALAVAFDVGVDVGVQAVRMVRAVAAKAEVRSMSVSLFQMGRSASSAQAFSLGLPRNGTSFSLALSL
jgi:hypothetical protein